MAAFKSGKLKEAVWYPLGAAIQFLTRFPFPAAVPFTAPVLSRSLVFFPLAGMLIGLLLAAVCLLSQLLLPPHPAAVVLLAVWVAASGGLHLDGLMDTADGTLSGRDRQRMLDIMKDSRVGAMGVIVAVIVLLMKYALLLEFIPFAEWKSQLPSLMLIPVWSRWWLVCAIIRWPYAGSREGLGRYFQEAGNVQLGRSLLLGLVLSAGCSIIWGSSLLPLIMAVVGMPLLSLVGGSAVAAWIARRLGGLTGDTYGAMNELLEMLLLLAAVIMLEHW